MPIPTLTRRTLFHGSAFAVVSAIVGYVVGRNSSAAEDRPTGGANGYGAGGGGGQVLTTLGAIPANGLVVDGVVLTHTDSGGVHGVSATCTHQGCTVGNPKHGTVTCPCHGSEFDAATGKVLRGPATSPLPEIAVTLQGDQVVRV